MRRISTWSLVCAAGCVALAACGGDDPTETGTVSDDATLEVAVASACEPLADVTVQLFGDGEAAATATATTDPGGEAAFTGLAGGQYVVAIEPPAGHGPIPEDTTRKATVVTASVTRRVAFALVPDPQPPVTDHEGHTYATVKIGDQVWMGEDLRVTTFANGEAIPHRESDAAWQEAADGHLPGWSYYENDPDYGAVYGPLYNSYAVLDPRGVCPTGWHIPTEDDWGELELELGIDSLYLDRIGVAGNDVGAGAMLKSTRTDPTPHPRWDAPNDEARNCTGFSGMPAGYRVGQPYTSDQVTGQFRQIGREGGAWSATQSADGKGPFGHGLLHGTSGIYRNTGDGFGFTARCIKDSGG